MLTDQNTTMIKSKLFKKEDITMRLLKMVEENVNAIVQNGLQKLSKKITLGHLTNK